MQVEHVWVDDISSHDGTGAVQSIRYSFGDARWVSVHLGAEGDQLGPVTIVDGDQSIEAPAIKRQQLGSRPLPTADAISFSDLHTLSRSTLYILLLPADWIADELHVLANDEPVELLPGATSDGRLFHHRIAGYQETIEWQIEARIKQSPTKSQELVNSVDVVRGTSTFSRLREHARGVALSPELWGSIVGSQLPM